jgi:CRISPR-associated protein Cas1
MHLFIQEYGARLEIEDEMLKVCWNEEVRKFSFLKIQSINVLKPGSLTTAVLLTAANYQVPLLIYSMTGKVEAWIWSPKYGNIANLRKQQVYFSDSEAGIKWTQELLVTKLQHQIQNLRWMADRIVTQKKILLNTVERIQPKIERIQLTQDFDSMRGFEGSSSKWYWAALSKGMESKIRFTNRQKKGAKDVFNKCLNYLYGILYGVIEASLLMTGLDPYMGIYHVIRHDRPTLVFDHIEPFRPWIDKMLIDLIRRGKLDPECLEVETGFIKLETRKILIETFFQNMEEKSKLNHKMIKRVDHIHYLSRILAQRIREFYENKNDLL